MTFDIATLIGLVSTVVGAAIGYGKLQGRIDHMGEKIKGMEDWREGHEREVQNIRVSNDVRFTAVEVKQGRAEEKFEQISRDVSDIKSDLRTLLNRRRDDRNDHGQSHRKEND